MVVFIGGALAIAFARVVLALWHEHLKADQDDRDQRDRALAALEQLAKGVALSAAAQADMAKAWDERNKADAIRRRRGDGRP